MSTPQYAQPPQFAQQYQQSPTEAPQELVSSKYETALPLRVDFAASLCYVLGPFSAILMLIGEWRNAYVRYHAYQSALVFTGMMVVHLLFVFVSAVVSWLLFAVDLVLIAWLMWQAYANGQTLVRYELPLVGPLANRWVEAEMETVALSDSQA